MPSFRSHRRPSVPTVGSLAVVVAAVAIFVAPLSSPALARNNRPNIVFIVTDDQRWDTLWAMPTVKSRLVDRGVTFSNGFVSNPLCCPARASILTGDYSHTTGVYTNKERSPYGGFGAFDDRSTLATWLQKAGYRTGLFGKYLNGYPGGYVPPGWDRWFATYDNEGYYNYLANDDGADLAYGSRPQDYGTTVIGQQAADFIRNTDPSQPLFAYIAPHAPHAPATPGPGDETAFSNLASSRPPAYDESNVSDKPQYIRNEPRMDRRTRDRIDAFRVDQYRALLAVDRDVGHVLNALGDTGRLSQTLIVFTSDNGMLWGEHRWHKKSVPYEESIRVPFVVRYDPLVGRPGTDPNLAVNIDLAPTAADLAGVGHAGADGSSLVPLLQSRNASWRSDFLLEHLGDRTDGVPTYCGVRSRTTKYVYYATGEEELYNLQADPSELDNLAATGGNNKLLRTMRSRLANLCSPAPPGMSLPSSWSHRH
jgi:N-acetylglucosamine-6-sulfatase